MHFLSNYGIQPKQKKENVSRDFKEFKCGTPLVPSKPIRNKNKAVYLRKIKRALKNAFPCEKNKQGEGRGTLEAALFARALPQPSE